MEDIYTPNTITNSQCLVEFDATMNTGRSTGTGVQNFVSPKEQKPELIYIDDKPLNKSMSFNVENYQQIDEEESYGDLLYQIDIELGQHNKTISLQIHEGEDMDAMLLKMKEAHGLTDQSMDQIKMLLDEQLSQQKHSNLF